MKRLVRIHNQVVGFTCAALASAAAVLSIWAQTAQTPQPTAVPKSATAPKKVATAAGVRADAQAPYQQGRTLVSAFPAPVPFPNQNEKAVQNHFNKARAIAGQDLYVFFDTLCIQDQLYKERTQGAQQAGIIPPQQVFDNLFYVGQMAVSAWALKTSAGIILFDSLDNADQARSIIVPGLQKMGLDSKDVRYVVITHSHADHYGGAQFFKEMNGSILVSSVEDWKAMSEPVATIRPQVDAPPKKGARDLALKDGDVLTLGDETVHFAVTPGHTAGTLSSYFEVTDRGVPHVVGFYGGIGMPRAVAAQNQQIVSLTRWMQVAKAAGVDAQIGNHPLHFDGPVRLEVLKYRTAQEPNPFVIGRSKKSRKSPTDAVCEKR
jgi:metallo-beta-lactamase class B